MPVPQRHANAITIYESAPIANVLPSCMFKKDTKVVSLRVSADNLHSWSCKHEMMLDLSAEGK